MVARRYYARLPAGGTIYAVGWTARHSSFQAAEAHSGGNRPHRHSTYLLWQDGQWSLDLLRHLGDLHDRLHLLRTYSPSTHRLALVPAESREGHGNRVCRRGADGFSRLIPREAAHRESRLSCGPHDP